jgi:GDP/UDP-N,N'-diacetylbacillosamine 2-epimerase (hydrolysing)
MKKICIISGTRAESGLLSPLMHAIKGESHYELQIIVSGMHLSPEFGLTYREIEKEGFTIDEKVETLLSSDTDIGIIKSTGLGMIGFADSINRLKPDLIVLLGDRFETFAAATAAYLAKIPIAHLHGGETTEGATDEGLRHAITKMSYWHFTSTEAYRKRVIQLGESPERVFNVGAIGIDNIANLSLLSKKDLSESLAFDLEKPFLLVTFHPVTLENNSAEQQFMELLKAFEYLSEINVIFTKPNADANGRIIIELINKSVGKNPTRYSSYTSLGQLRYLSLMKYATAVVGNSSSGIIEAPSFGVPTINIGDRQKGRIAANSVIHVPPIAKKIFDTIVSVQKIKIKNISNPYGIGDTTKRIMKIIGRSLHNIELKKNFHDLN